MEQLNFTKEYIKIVKRVAILLMRTHHLFAFPDRIHINRDTYVKFEKRQCHAGGFF